MAISLLVAMSENNVIGQGDKLPWHIPSELKHFAKQTAGKAMLVGRKTWASMAHIDLKDRIVYVITSDPEGCLNDPKLVSDRNVSKVIFNTCPERIIEEHLISKRDLIVVGGKSIYERCAKYCDRFVVTTIKREYEGDVKLDIFSGLSGISNNRYYTEHVDANRDTDTPAYVVKRYNRHMPDYPEPVYITPEEYKELVETKGVEHDLEYGSSVATRLLDKSVVVLDPKHDSYYQKRVSKIIGKACNGIKEQFRYKVAQELLSHVFVRPSFHNRTPTATVLAHVETLARRLPRTAFDMLDIPVTEADRNTTYLVFPKPIKTFSEGKLSEVASRTWNTKKLVILGLKQSPDYERLKSLITKGLRKYARQKGVEIQFKG